MARTSSDFVAAGVNLVLERGFDQLTSRHLGEAMGVHSTAIYRHFPQWDLLIFSVTDAVLGAFLAGHSASLASVTDPRERILTIMLLLRQQANEHPDIATHLLALAAAPAAVATPNADAMARVVLGSLEELGLTGEHLVRSYQVLESYTVGAMAFDLAGHPDHLVNRRDRRRALGESGFSEVIRSVQDAQRINDGAFEFGAAALLDACIRTRPTDS